MTNKITEEKLLLNLVFEVSFPVFSIHTHYWYHILSPLRKTVRGHGATLLSRRAVPSNKQV